MITLLISRGYVYGAEESLAGWAVCAAIYFAVSLAFRYNRTPAGLRRMGISFLIAELLVDLAWCLIWYGEDGYVNLGHGSAFLLILWPGALLAAGVIATALNQAETL